MEIIMRKWYAFLSGKKMLGIGLGAVVALTHNDLHFCAITTAQCILGDQELSPAPFSPILANICAVIRRNKEIFKAFICRNCPLPHIPENNAVKSIYNLVPPLHTCLLHTDSFHIHVQYPLRLP